MCAFSCQCTLLCLFYVIFGSQVQTMMMIKKAKFHSLTIFPKPAMNVWNESPEASDHNSLCRPAPALCRLRHRIPGLQCLRCLAKSANVMEIYDAWEPGSETQKYVRNILLIHFGFGVRNEDGRGVRISTVNYSTAVPPRWSRLSLSNCCEA